MTSDTLKSVVLGPRFVLRLSVQYSHVTKCGHLCPTVAYLAQDTNSDFVEQSCRDPKKLMKCRVFARDTGKQREARDALREGMDVVSSMIRRMRGIQPENLNSRLNLRNRGLSARIIFRPTGK